MIPCTSVASSSESRGILVAVDVSGVEAQGERRLPERASRGVRARIRSASFERTNRANAGVIGSIAAASRG
jgi:hypothetical protein